MCLSTTMRAPKITKRPLICYKKVLKGTKYIRTFYTNTRIPEEIIQGKETLKANRSNIKWQNLVADRWVNPATGDEILDFGPGYIHAYRNGKRAIKRFGRYKKVLIYRCEIPAGVEYFENGTEYCARELRFVELIHPIQ